LEEFSMGPTKTAAIAGFVDCVIAIKEVARTRVANAIILILFLSLAILICFH
jgi:Flp pilus assembly protein protease CpaA